MSKWRLAKSLERLRYEVDTLYPKRSKVSDGAKGDSAHAKRKSDHNVNTQGVVCAIDITHDPKNGADMSVISNHLAKHPHPDLDCLIFNGMISTRKSKFKWKPYNGKNKHNHHMHVSVGYPWGKLGEATSLYDDEDSWLKNFEQDAEPPNMPMTTKLMVNDEPFEKFIVKYGFIHINTSTLVAAINGVNGVKASLVWNEKTKTAKLYVRSAK